MNDNLNLYQLGENKVYATCGVCGHEGSVTMELTREDYHRRRPKRIQRRRHKGWRMPELASYVGRPTRWGNPFRVGQSGIDTPKMAADAYRMWLNTTNDGRYIARAARLMLAGRDLACWCPEGHACHADALLAVANPTVWWDEDRVRRKLNAAWKAAGWKNNSQQHGRMLCHRCASELVGCAL